MGRRIVHFALLAGLAAVPGPASAQIQSTYDYLLLPHSPQSDSARTYSYDANGNLVQSTVPATGVSKTLEYTPSNMVSKAGGSEYRYDTSGIRIAKIQRDANGNITKIERYFGAIETDGTTRTKHYFFGSKRVAKKTSSGALSFYHSDHLNSTSVVTDASGNLQSRIEFYEFGSVKSQEGTDSPKYAYTGQEWDKESNLYNYNARMYDSAIGKFTTADSTIPSITDPQSLNRYAYTLNNPLRYRDSTGHAAETLAADFSHKQLEKITLFAGLSQNLRTLMEGGSKDYGSIKDPRLISIQRNMSKGSRYTLRFWTTAKDAAAFDQDVVNQFMKCTEAAYQALDQLVGAKVHEFDIVLLLNPPIGKMAAKTGGDSNSIMFSYERFAGLLKGAPTSGTLQATRRAVHEFSHGESYLAEYQPDIAFREMQADMVAGLYLLQKDSEYFSRYVTTVIRDTDSTTQFTYFAINKIHEQYGFEKARAFVGNFLRPQLLGPDAFNAAAKAAGIGETFDSLQKSFENR